MNKTALKNFATSGRRELLKKVKAKALKIGITAETITKVEIESSDAIFIDGRQLSKEEKIQRDKLIGRINQIGFNRVMEEVAYTWFNRFTALRFMEVNNYLPTKVRVLTSSNSDSAEPDMIKEALSLDLDLDNDLVYELMVNQNTDELFKYLIIKHCNDLNRYMPFMFETIDDYTEILFPEGLLAKESFIRKMTNTKVIPEGNWEKVEVIGWLYQFYISEEKERVFKQKKKYKAEEIPYATQLFTPHWIVHYMVQNSLGRYWIESHQEHRDILEKWEFYLENPDPEHDFEEKLAPYINKELKVEDIKCFDPAMGSGHILVYMFDVLYEIYSKCGYMDREIPRMIIENNLYGLDIDDRAYQLACFSVVMKALEYNKRFFRSIEREGLTLNLASIQETNILNEEDIVYIAGESEGEKFEKTKEFIEQFRDAKTFGSLLKVNGYEKQFLEKILINIKENPAQNLFEEEVREKVLLLLIGLTKQAEIMFRRYDILVTNPPYMGSKYMNEKLSEFLNKHYPDSKGDLFASFMEIDQYLIKGGMYSAINQHSWMFISSFEKLRAKIISNKTIVSMMHLGSRAFEEIGGEVVQSTSFVLRNLFIPINKGIYLRLVNEKTALEKYSTALEIIKNGSQTVFKQDNYYEVPGNAIAYWSSEQAIKNFSNIKFGEIAKARAGMITGDNLRFTRLWHEVKVEKIGFGYENRESGRESKKVWFPYNKGGGYRKWYGNNEYLVNWYNDGYLLKNTKDEDGKVPAHAFNHDYIFKKAITWSSIMTSKFSARSCEKGSLFDAGGSFAKADDNHYYFLGYLNSVVSDYYLNLINPTLNIQKGNIEDLPIIKSNNKVKVENLVKENISISQNEWNSFENSWDFKSHPIISHKKDSTIIEQAFKNWEVYIENQYYQLKANEEELNKVFIESYGLADELTPAVGEKGVTISKADLERDIKSFISYAISCMFGRYSLAEEGLIYAGGEFEPNRYQTFKADKDNILPILQGAYFEDDIVSRLIEFVRVTFGEEKLVENLDFIADSLGKKKGEMAKETIRRYFLNGFFKDHLQTYKKRPIYWLFTSGKQKAFNCLIYMHRYDKTTLSRIRTEYLHEYQIRLDAEKKGLLNIIEVDSSAKEISNAKTELKVLDKKIEELKEYDELLHHMADMQIEIDLDDGVTVNYNKFKGLVAKI